MCLRLCLALEALLNHHSCFERDRQTWITNLDNEASVFYFRIYPDNLQGQVENYLERLTLERARSLLTLVEPYRNLYHKEEDIRSKWWTILTSNGNNQDSDQEYPRLGISLNIEKSSEQILPVALKRKVETNSINPIPGRKRAKKEKKELVDKKKQITREDRSQPIVFVSVPAPSSTSTAQICDTCLQKNRRCDFPDNTKKACGNCQKDKIACKINGISRRPRKKK